MPQLNARSDLYDNLTDVTGGIDMDNVTGLSTRPKIIINGREFSDDGGEFASGTLDLERETYRMDTRHTDVYRDDRFVIEATFVMVDQDDDSTARQILDEIDRVLINYTRTLGHKYEYEMMYEVFSDRGTVEFEIDFVMIARIVDVTA